MAIFSERIPLINACCMFFLYPLFFRSKNKYLLQVWWELRSRIDPISQKQRYSWGWSKGYHSPRVRCAFSFSHHWCWMYCFRLGAKPRLCFEKYVDVSYLDLDAFYSIRELTWALKIGCRRSPYSRSKPWDQRTFGRSLRKARDSVLRTWWYGFQLTWYP